MERLTVLGTGNAMVTKCYNTCFTISDGQEHFLVDGGGGNTILSQLEKTNIEINKIQNVFVSHNHNDHILGIIWIIRAATQGILNKKYEGNLNIYCHESTTEAIKLISSLVLNKKFTNLFESRVVFHNIKDGDKAEILGREITFFDIGSTKDLQFGFHIALINEKTLTFLGDEPYSEKVKPYASNVDYLLHEAFCLYEEKEIFKPYKNYIVDEDRQFVVYLKITDYAGNYTYINSEGYIVDQKASSITLTPSAANGFYDAAANKGGQYGLYNKNSNVKVDVKVEDAKPYSGIKTVDYWVENNNVRTQEGNLFTFDIENPAQKDLVKDWNGSITVDKALNNGCNIVVYVKTVDNAGNENIEHVGLDIDVTAPVIDIKFDNNKDNNGNAYFDDQRTATVTITERKHHFDAAKATESIKINAVDAKGNPVENAYTISAWTTVDNDQSPDEATHTATIFFERW